MFPRAMWIALAPYLVAAACLTLVAAAVNTAGAPAWTAYAALTLCCLIVLPGCLRWEKTQGDD
jgi:hypothetical protein